MIESSDGADVQASSPQRAARRIVKWKLLLACGLVSLRVARPLTCRQSRLGLLYHTILHLIAVEQYRRSTRKESCASDQSGGELRADFIVDPLREAQLVW